MKKYFIITVDTEGDNLWSYGNSSKYVEKITIENGKYIERFQILCEKYRLVPTYLTNYEMTLSRPFQQMAKEALKNKRMEIGMHLHAFNNPPVTELPNRRGGGKAYAGEYPIDILSQKVDYLTKTLEDTFQTSIKSHRGGRWYLDEKYIYILKKYGYLVDCTVTPGVDWRNHPGHTEFSQGVDYRRFYHRPYELSLKDIKKRGGSGILEVPVTIRRKSLKYIIKNYNPWIKEDWNEWLRPTGNNLRTMKELLCDTAKGKHDYVEFMIHSSELMPGGSPTFPNRIKIEKLYADLEELFSFASNYYKGITLTQYRELYFNKPYYRICRKI